MGSSAWRVLPLAGVMTIVIALSTIWPRGGAKSGPRTTTPPLHGTTVLVVADERSERHYEANLLSVQCLCSLKGYSLVVTDGGGLEECSGARSIYFRKHCVARSILSRHPEVGTLLVLDADTAVINPEDHRIEDYIPSGGRDVVFYLRFHNNEFVAGNYVVRNTEWARAFLRDWYEIGSGGGAYPGFSGVNEDNGALHWLLLHRLGGANSVASECIGRGRVATWASYPAFVACVHGALALSGCNTGDWDRVGVLPHGEGWAYDGWIVKHRWSNSTFMHHAMKNPPIGGDNEGRMMPPGGACPPFPDRRSDPYFVSESELARLLGTKAHRAMAGRMQHGYDPSSCVLAHR